MLAPRVGVKAGTPAASASGIGVHRVGREGGRARSIPPGPRERDCRPPASEPIATAWTPLGAPAGLPPIGAEAGTIAAPPPSRSRDARWRRSSGARSGDGGRASSAGSSPASRPTRSSMPRTTSTRSSCRRSGAPASRACCSAASRRRSSGSRRSPCSRSAPRRSGRGRAGGARRALQAAAVRTKQSHPLVARWLPGRVSLAGTATAGEAPGEKEES